MMNDIMGIASVMCKSCEEVSGGCKNTPCGNVLREARRIYDAGYRKQSEVVNKICCDIKQEITAALDSNYRVRGELDVTDDLYHIVNGKISALRGIEGFITEIENKYNKN